jgi:hypothetical protein
MIGGGVYMRSTKTASINTRDVLSGSIKTIAKRLTNTQIVEIFDTHKKWSRQSTNKLADIALALEILTAVEIASPISLVSELQQNSITIEEASCIALQGIIDGKTENKLIARFSRMLHVAKNRVVDAIIRTYWLSVTLNGYDLPKIGGAR